MQFVTHFGNVIEILTLYAIFNFITPLDLKDPYRCHDMKSILATEEDKSGIHEIISFVIKVIIIIS